MHKQEFHFIENKNDIQQEIENMRETFTFSLARSEAFTNLVQSLFM